MCLLLTLILVHTHLSYIYTLYRHNQQGGKQYPKDRSNRGGRFNGKYYDRETQKNRVRGQQSRLNNNKDNRNQHRGSKKASAKGNTKNKKNNASKVSKTVVAPDMSATNFPSLLSAPSADMTENVSSATSVSPTTSPTLAKASAYADILKKKSSVVKTKKRAVVSPKSESTSSSSKTNSIKTKASGNSKKNSNPKTVVESKDKNNASSLSSEKPKPRARRGWEKTDELKQAKEEARRRAHEEALKRKALDDKSNTKRTTDHKVRLAL